MDNKEKVLVDFAMKCINVDRKGEALNVNSYAKEALEKLQPSKVKLPRAAYEWMEEKIKLNIYDFECEIFKLQNFRNSLEKDLKNFYMSEGSVFTLVDAYRYGYELEETEEERIRSEIRKIHFDAGIMVTDDVLEKLYNIATKK